MTKKIRRISKITTFINILCVLIGIGIAAIGVYGNLENVKNFGLVIMCYILVLSFPFSIYLLLLFKQCILFDIKTIKDFLGYIKAQITNLIILLLNVILYYFWSWDKFNPLPITSKFIYISSDVICFGLLCCIVLIQYALFKEEHKKKNSI